MKKSLVLSVAVAAMVGISSTCFAGFGVPGIPKAPKAAKTTEAKPAAESKQSAPVDLSDITNKQAQMLKYVCGGVYAQCRAFEVVYQAMGIADPELAEVKASLQGGKTSDVKKARTKVGKMQTKTAELLKTVDKNKVQVDNLAKALKTGKAYQQAAIVNYGFVAANAPKALKEATDAIKGLGSNPVAASKVNGAIATYKLGLDLAGGAQTVASEYEKRVEEIKSNYGVDQAAMDAAQSPDINAIANDCLDFVEGK